MFNTLDALLKEDIVEMTEYEGCYYIRLAKEVEDDTVWKVDIATGKATYVQFPWYIAYVAYKARDVDPDTVKGVS